MEITVNNTRFNITAEDLESADVEFSFWEGRRFKCYGKDVKEHFLRYNDIVKGVLAEDAIFIEVEDKQKIYTALNNLKDKGYPYKGSWETTLMLWFKQLFGNIFRQELLDQLETKLNVENEELGTNDELSNSEESNCEALISPICRDHYVDVLPLLFKYAGRTAFFPLMRTCKLFQKIITEDKHLNYLRDFDLLKQIFKECQHTKFDFDSRAPQYRPKIETTNIIDIESKCILLLAEFLPKEANRITPPNEIYEQNEAYIKHQQKLAIVLAKIDPKSALKVVSSMDKERYPVQTFCAVAAIHKNSTLCDEKQVLEMGDKAYADPTLLSHNGLFNGSKNCSIGNRFYCVNLMELFEASLGIHFPLENKTLELMDNYPAVSVHPYGNVGRYIQDLAKMVKRIEVNQLIESKFREAVVNLLKKPLELDLGFEQDSQFNMAQTLAVLAKTLVIFDQKKAIQALDLALNSVTELDTELDSDVKVGALIEIAEAFADFDQDQAFEVAKLALREAEGLYVWNKGLRDIYFKYRIRLFNSLDRIIKIFATSNREYAIQVLGEIADKIRIMDENVVLSELKEFRTHWETFFDQFPIELFLGAIELYASFNPKRAFEMANLGVEWAKTRSPRGRLDEEALLKLSQILLKNFPDQALEVANMLSLSEFKCQALLSIVSQGSDYS